MLDKRSFPREELMVYLLSSECQLMANGRGLSVTFEGKRESVRSCVNSVKIWGELKKKATSISGVDERSSVGLH